MVDYKTFDPDLWAAIAKEEERQENNLELIASENFVSEAVMAAQGSILQINMQKVTLGIVIMVAVNLSISLKV